MKKLLLKMVTTVIVIAFFLVFFIISCSAASKNINTNEFYPLVETKDFKISSNGDYNFNLFNNEASVVLLLDNKKSKKLYKNLSIIDFNNKNVSFKQGSIYNYKGEFLEDLPEKECNKVIPISDESVFYSVYSIFYKLYEKELGVNPGGHFTINEDKWSFLYNHGDGEVYLDTLGMKHDFSNATSKCTILIKDRNENQVMILNTIFYCDIYGYKNCSIKFYELSTSKLIKNIPNLNDKVRAITSENITEKLFKIVKLSYVMEKKYKLGANK